MRALASARALSSLTSNSFVPRSCCRQDSILFKPFNDDVPRITDVITSLPGVANSRRIRSRLMRGFISVFKAVESVDCLSYF